METRANYVLIGAFTLAAVVGAFLFVMWIAGYGSSGSHRSFQVVFSGSVAGLSTGANVSFNGIKVGEVTHLTFSRSDPHQVVADIDVNSDAPIDRNTRARLETQGLTGGAVVALLGGTTAGSALVGANGRPPVIYAGQSVQLQDILDSVAALSTKATSVLDDADKIIADNAPTIHSALTNVDQFSKALADNSAGVDAALKSVGEIGKQIGPLAARLQTLSDDADRLVQSIDTEKVRSIVDNIQGLSAKGNSVVDRADKLLADNADSIHSTLQNADAFAKTLADNAPNVDTTLKNLAEISKTIQPVVAQIQSLSQNADRVLKAVDPDKVRTIVDNVQNLSAKGNSVVDRADKLLADNSASIHSTLENADVFARALADNAPNVDATLKNLADLSKTVQPVVAQIQSLSQNADRVVKAVDPDKVRAVVGNVQTFSQALSESSQNFETLARNGAQLATHLNEDTSKRLDTALNDVNDLAKAIDSQKIAGIVDSANDVVQTVHQNRGNIDLTLKNFAEMSAKLNESADKVDGVLTSAQSFLGSPGTKGAVDRISDAALSVKKLADDVDVRVKDIATGLSRFTNTGLREYEALAIEGRRAVEDIDRVVRSLGQNPSQVIFGSRPSLPEYHGGQ
jgi:phospholipid/cholesterol/gamma-HCH transport system substrate-binding protein